MVRTIFISFFVLLHICFSSSLQAQFASAHVNKKKVLVEQGIKVKITAYSPTWFAEPLQIKNLQINGAFIQSFSRTVPSIKHVNGKKYAALDFYYILFPYKEGELIFPELELKTSIPPEGDYKGVPTTLKTKEIKIIVEGVPKNMDPDHWLVANDVSIENKWSKDIKKLMVGDVVNRKISIRAKGTLPTFIDAVEIGELDFASIYTNEPSFIDERDDQNVNGKRIDSYSYLIEEKGEFTIPETEIQWWNPYTKRSYKRILPEYTLIVSDNPELASLEQLKDSLNLLNAPLLLNDEPEEEKIDYKRYVKIGLIAIIAIMLLLWLIKKVKYLIVLLKEKRRKRLESEAHYFRKILVSKGDKNFLNSIYRWFDRSKSSETSKTLRSLGRNDEEYNHELTNLFDEFYSQKEGEKPKKNLLIKKLIQWRKRFSPKRKKKIKKNHLGILNPK